METQCTKGASASRLCPPMWVFVVLLSIIAGTGSIRAVYAASQQPVSQQAATAITFNETSDAAIAGDAVAQMRLAEMLLEGRGVPKSVSTGFSWMQRSAQAGHIPAMRALAQLYFKGIGTKIDDRQGLYWLLQAADDKDPEAAYVLAREWERVSGDSSNNPDAYDFYLAAAKGGNASAQARLGQILENGLHGVKVDAAAAATWYEKSALQGNVTASRSLGRLYDEGRGVAPDARKAAQFFARAAAKGDSESLNALGERFAVGKGVPRSLPVAVALFSMAIDADEDGSPTAAANRRKYFSDLTATQQTQVKRLVEGLARPGALIELLGGP